MSNEFVIDLYDQNMFIYVKIMFWVKPKSIDVWKNRRTSRFMISGRSQGFLKLNSFLLVPNEVQIHFKGPKFVLYKPKFVCGTLSSFGETLNSFGEVV